MKIYPSHLNLFQQCPLRYRFRYIDQRHEPVSPPLYLGARVHDTLDRFFGEPAERRDLHLLEDIFRKEWAGSGLSYHKRRRRVRERQEAFAGDVETERRYGESGLEMLKKFWLSPALQIQPVDREAFLEQTLFEPKQADDGWPYDEPLILGGKVDRIDAAGGGLKVLDYKTNRSVPSGVDHPAVQEALATALPVYAYLVEQVYRKPVHHVGLVYLREGKTLEFSLDDGEPERVIEKVKTVARQIKQMQTFEPQQNPYCPCGFEHDCPLFRDAVPF